MEKHDLKEYKKTLRNKFRKIREEMSYEEKSRRDAEIYSRVISSEAYRASDTVLTYVSTAIEVDTSRIIKKAVSDGKKVYVPKCVSGTRLMDFYRIASEADLEKGAFGVMEPDPSKCEKAGDTAGALCIVPGLSFDMEGYRLGYGGGYYDRFVNSHGKMILMGICYCICTSDSLPRGYFDRRVDYLATEKYIKRITEV